MHVNMQEKTNTFQSCTVILLPPLILKSMFSFQQSSQTRETEATIYDRVCQFHLMHILPLYNLMHYSPVVH